MKLIDWIDRTPARIGFGYGGVRSAASASTSSFSSRADVETTVIADANVTHIRTEGYGTLGDGGGALYLRVETEPTHAGKISSANGQWWEYVPGAEGVNVRAFGAIGNGQVADDTAVSDAWAYSLANKVLLSGPPGGAALYFPEGEYLLSQNDPFGNPGVSGQHFWLTIRGAGRGVTTLRFRPTTGNSAFADDKYYLFDGGDGVTTSAFKPLIATVENLLILLEDDNLVAGDEIWVWRQDGTGGQQGIDFEDCEIRGPGTMTAGHVRSGFMDLVGSTNTSENRFTRVRFWYLSHLLRTTNDQSKDCVFIECDPWLIHDHFLICDGGALAMRIFGGSWIWPDAGGDTSPQYLLTVDGVSDPGLGNMKFSAFGMETEMRSDDAALIRADDTTAALFASFSHCSFAGGNVETKADRNVTMLNQNKVVAFDHCNFPSNFGFEFVATNGALGDIEWTKQSMGLVKLDTCALNGDLSDQITKAGDAGRVLATNCFSAANVATGHPSPRDFDSNPFNCGTQDPPPMRKMATGIPEAAIWNDGKVFRFTLPYGARLQSVKCYRPASGGSDVRTMTLSDGNQILGSVVGPENGGLSIDHEPPASALMSPRTDANARELSLTVDALASGVTGALFLVEWI